MKVIVAGSRCFDDSWYFSLEEQLDKSGWHITEVVSGGAYGADKLGEEYARLHDIPVKKFLANWDKYGKSAGYRRNVEMAGYADACFVLWNGESKGSKHMIDIAKAKGLPLIVADI